MLILEIILEDDLLEEMQIVAEIMGIDVEMVIVMACQKYIQSINQYGFPQITGLRLRVDDPSEGDATNGEKNGLQNDHGPGE